MHKGQCDIGTLASTFRSKTELKDENNVKVVVKDKLDASNFVEATDFLRTSSIKYSMTFAF